MAGEVFRHQAVLGSGFKAGRQALDGFAPPIGAPGAIREGVMGRELSRTFALIMLAASVVARPTAADLSQGHDWDATPPAAGDAAEALTAAREAMHAAWLGTPLRVAKAVLVATSDNKYGIYEPRGSHRYAPGEPIMIYVEPVGYGYRKEGELWHFGLAADLFVLDKAGNILAGKEGALRTELTSHNPVKELVLDVTYTLNNAPAGVYVLRTILRDHYSDEQVRFENVVEIARGSAS
jgi:hypothetical protein